MSRKQRESTIVRSSVYDAFVQLGGLNEDGLVKQWMFGESSSPRGRTRVHFEERVLIEERMAYEENEEENGGRPKPKVSAKLTKLRSKSKSRTRKDEETLASSNDLLKGMETITAVVMESPRKSPSAALKALFRKDAVSTAHEDLAFSNLVTDVEDGVGRRMTERLEDRNVSAGKRVPYALRPYLAPIVTIQTETLISTSHSLPPSPFLLVILEDYIGEGSQTPTTRYALSSPVDENKLREQPRSPISVSKTVRDDNDAYIGNDLAEKTHEGLLQKPPSILRTGSLRGRENAFPVRPIGDQSNGQNHAYCPT